VGVTFETPTHTEIPHVAHTCPGYREKANPNTKNTMTPTHDLSLSVLLAESTARYTIIATNGNKYAATFKYLKQKDRVLWYY
jgi:hypothetical protein